MPYSFDFDSTARILRCRFEGRITGEDLWKFRTILPRYFALMNPRGSVTDFSAISSFDVTADEMRALARREPAVPHDGPQIMVAPLDHVFGSLRIFEIEGGATRPHLHVVRTWESAYAILGVRKLKFESIQAEGET